MSKKHFKFLQLLQLNKILLETLKNKLKITKCLLDSKIDKLNFDHLPHSHSRR